MLTKLKKLIDVKSIVTISLTIVFCLETFRGHIEVKDFMTIYSMITAFYFCTQAKKEKGANE